MLCAVRWRFLRRADSLVQRSSTVCMCVRGQTRNERTDPTPVLNFSITTWSDNKVRELFAVKVLHTSLLNSTMVAFKVLPLGSYASMAAPSPPFKTILELVLWNGLQSCRCITPDVISVIKMPSFQYFLYLREQKKVTGGWIRWIDRVFQHSYLFSSQKLPHRQCRVSRCIVVKQVLFVVGKTHADSNRCHSEKDCHRSTTTTQLWNADMSTSSNHTKAFVQCCHGKHRVASSRT